MLTTTAGAVAGTGYAGACTASKAFVQIFGEALWCELGQHHVDMLVAMAGPADTPALRATGTDLEPLRPVLMDSRNGVAEVLTGLGSAGPLLPVGPASQGAVQQAWPVHGLIWC